MGEDFKYAKEFSRASTWRRDERKISRRLMTNSRTGGRRTSPLRPFVHSHGVAPGGTYRTVMAAAAAAGASQRFAPH